MKVGGITAPLEVIQPSGEKYYRLVKLISKSSPHKANLLQDYNKIQSATIEQKKNESLIKWIEQKSKSTFIKVDGMYNSCPNLEKWGKKV